MGVDWRVCPHCGDTYSDCGRYGTCSNCESSYCGSCFGDFVQVYGLIDESHERFKLFGESLPECDHCNGKIISDDEILAFALSKLGIDRDTLIEEYRANKKGDDALSHN
ncbi:hypothetical protein EEL32_10235 [Brevibacillus laterosporus]|nr:hypothetical protein EEL32_10235 [Brevibacillus laterosporus]